METLLLALWLALPSPSVSGPDRAFGYYRDGVDEYRRERFETALAHFEMAVDLARFRFGSERLVGDGLHMAALSAIGAGEVTPAVRHARAYRDWADANGQPRDRAAARLDLVQAYLLLGSADDARRALAEARRAVEARDARVEQARLEELAARLDRVLLADAGPGTTPFPPPTPDTPTPRPIPTAAPTPIVPSPTPVPTPFPPPSPSPPGTDPPPEHTPGPVPTPDTSPGPEPGVTPTPIAPPATPTPLELPEAPTPGEPTPIGPTPFGTPAVPTPARAPTPPSVAPVLAPRPADMVLIPAGTFRMGSSDGDPDERPVREVTLPAFWIDRGEVTNEEYGAFVESTGYDAAGDWERHAGSDRPRHPVRGVTWADAAAYCRWAGKRLPTEAEWERAASGTDSRRYSFGDAFGDGAARVLQPTGAGPVEVGTFPPGAFGLLDMTGNVLEWTADGYAPEAGAGAAGEAAARAATTRVLRGGSWSADAASARNAKRYHLPPGASRPDVGMRCARDAGS